MNFLRQEVKGEEMVLLAQTGLTPHQNPRKRIIMQHRANKVETTTAAALVNMDNPVKAKLYFCKRFALLFGVKVRKKLIRAVIDSGSQSTYVSENVITHLKALPLRSETVIHALFGGETKPKKHDIFPVEDWEKLNIIERVPDLELNKESHYLAHRPVIKLDSQTTKIRPVFDASASEKGKPSLNECLLKGTNLIELIPDILDRLGMYPIGISADIEKLS
ncbi:integrase catalytic domain-containing protein [Trichonephila clavipes]|nr:integrase catalytic domain-containing protein [Trichonephila clavipes]